MVSSSLPSTSHAPPPPPPPAPRAEPAARNTADQLKSSVLPAGDRPAPADRSPVANRSVGEVWCERAAADGSGSKQPSTDGGGGVGSLLGGSSRRELLHQLQQSRRGGGRRRLADPTGTVGCKPPGLSTRGASVGRVAFAASQGGEVAELQQLLESGPPSARRHPITMEEVGGDGKEKGGKYGAGGRIAAEGIIASSLSGWEDRRDGAPSGGSKTKLDQYASAVLGGSGGREGIVPSHRHRAAKSVLKLAFDGLPATADAHELRNSLAALGLDATHAKVSMDPLNGKAQGRGEIQLRGVTDKVGLLRKLEGKPRGA